MPKAAVRKTVQRRTSKTAQKTTAKPAKKGRTTAQVVAKPALEQPAESMPYKLPPVWRITRDAGQTLWQNRRIFGGITLIYALLSVLLIGGLSALLNAESVVDVMRSGGNSFTSALLAFALLLGGTGTTAGQVASGYQLLLIIVVSLALVWALRHVLAGTTDIRCGTEFYLGMYPLVPVILVFLVLLLQLIPLAVAMSVVSIVIQVISPSWLEWLPIAAVCLALVWLSIYLVIPTIFALYVAALPECRR